MLLVIAEKMLHRTKDFFYLSCCLTIKEAGMHKKLEGGLARTTDPG